MPSITREEAFAKLQQIFRDQFDRPDLVLRPEMTADDIAGWDSEAQVDIILACEEAFGIRLKARQINALESIGEMVDHLVSISAKGS